MSRLWRITRKKKRLEDVNLAGPTDRADIKKKKKIAKVPRGFEFNETIDEHWREIEHYLLEDATNSGQKSDTVGNPEFRAFTHSSSFVGNVIWDRESREMEILLNQMEMEICQNTGAFLMVVRGQLHTHLGSTM